MADDGGGIVVKAGYLYRQSKASSMSSILGSPRWHRRFVQLRPTSISFRDARSRGIEKAHMLDAEGATVDENYVPLASNRQTPGGVVFVFALRTRTRTWVLQADSAPDRSAWAKCLRDVISSRPPFPETCPLATAPRSPLLSPAGLLGRRVSGSLEGLFDAASAQASALARLGGAPSPSPSSSASSAALSGDCQQRGFLNGDVVVHACRALVGGCGGARDSAGIEGLLVVGRYALHIAARDGARALSAVHYWEIAEVSLDVPRGALGVKCRSAASVEAVVPTPVSLASALYSAMSVLCPREQLPQLKTTGRVGITALVPASMPRRSPLPSLLYAAQCSLMRRSPSAAFVTLLRRLEESGCRTLDLTRCACVAPEDMVARVAWLARDTWFRAVVAQAWPRVVASGCSVVSALASVLRFNKTLVRVCVRSAGIDDRSACDIGEALSSNRDHAVALLDLSHNALRDRGAESLASALSKFEHGLVSLNLASCGIGPRGMCALLGALEAHPAATLHLHALTLSHNKLDEPGSLALESLLSRRAQLGAAPFRVLRLAHTRLSLQTVVSLPFSVHEGSELDVSGARVDDADAAVLEKAIARRPAVLSLSACSFSQRSTFWQLCGALSDPRDSARQLRLDVSDLYVEASPEAAAAGLACISRPITRLDLCGVPLASEQLLAVVWPMSRSLEELYIARPARRLVDGSEDVWAESLSSLVLRCPRLVTLRVSEGYGPAVIRSLASALADCGCAQLRELDLSGNALGDAIAAYLAAVLTAPLCSSLRALRAERNCLSCEGVQTLADALEHNSTLTDLSLSEQKPQEPFREAEQARVSLALQAIAMLLARNAAGAPLCADPWATQLPAEVTSDPEADATPAPPPLFPLSEPYPYIRQWGLPQRGEAMGAVHAHRATVVQMEAHSVTTDSPYCRIDSLPPTRCEVANPGVRPCGCGRDCDIKCPVPALAPGDHRVAVSNEGRVYSSDYKVLQAVVAPSVACITPAHGRTGSDVWVTGSGFGERPWCNYRDANRSCYDMYGAVPAESRNATGVLCRVPSLRHSARRKDELMLQVNADREELYREITVLRESNTTLSSAIDYASGTVYMPAYMPAYESA
eukprot:m51a1_g8468 hypothetical protein (1104) ;mRNA; r:466356-476253